MSDGVKRAQSGCAVLCELTVELRRRPKRDEKLASVGILS